jgi:hypothetical protein
LAIRDVVTEGGLPVMWSLWEPTPDEIAAIAAGAKVLLSVVGTAHPPVGLYVQPQEGQA